MTLPLSLPHLSGACEAKIGGRQAEQCAEGASEAGWGHPNKLRQISAPWKIPTPSGIGGTATNSKSSDPSRGGANTTSSANGSGGSPDSGGTKSSHENGGSGVNSAAGGTSDTCESSSGGTTSVGGTKSTAGSKATGGFTAAVTSGGSVTTVALGGKPGSGGTTSAGGSTQGAAGSIAVAEEWVPSWATSIQKTETKNLPPTSLAGNTLRQFVWPTFSGAKIRIQLSNERGNGSVEIKKVHIATATGSDASTTNGKVETSTDKEFLFQGAAAVTIQKGATVWSDPLAFDLQELKLTAITALFGSQVPDDITGHPGARTTSYVSSGDAVSKESLSDGKPAEHWYYVNAIEVMAPADVVAIAAFGDSITDGYGVKNTFSRWPDYLTLAIKQDSKLAKKRTVLNFGMGSNNLTVSGAEQDSGLVRFDRDVMKRDKVKYVVFLEGVNDILYSNVQKQPIVDAYKQIMAKAQSKKIFVFGSPIPPLDKSASGVDAAKEGIRKSVNDSVRNEKIFDQVIDFADLLADPNNESIYQAKYAGDPPHPNLAGYEAMGNFAALPFSE